MEPPSDPVSMLSGWVIRYKLIRLSFINNFEDTKNTCVFSMYSDPVVEITEGPYLL